MTAQEFGVSLSFSEFHKQILQRNSGGYRFPLKMYHTDVVKDLNVYDFGNAYLLHRFFRRQQNKFGLSFMKAQATVKRLCKIFIG